MDDHIVWNRTQSKWVANPGLRSSYTTLREKARVFGSREIAEQNACGDEMVVAK